MGLNGEISLFNIAAIADYIEKAKALYQEYKQRKKESKQEQSLENTNQKKRKKK
jgi:type III secretory pathway component EscR